MQEDYQKLTKSTYEDPKMVAGYALKHGRNPKLHDLVEYFAKTIPGKRVIDIGCGPGHDSYKFAELGFEVVGVDYSTEMIKTAKKFKTIANPPEFSVLDMRKIGDNFAMDSFDGAWISASLLHIPEVDVPKVLTGLKKIVKNGGRIYIGIKGGEQGASIIKENKYDMDLRREFIFWDKKNFSNLLKKFRFKIVEFKETSDGITGDKPTSWLNYQVEVVK